MANYVSTTIEGEYFTPTAGLLQSIPGGDYGHLPAARWILANGVPFIHISIFSDTQAAIKSLSNVANNSRIVRKCRRCLDHLSERFSVLLIWVSGHCDISGNCGADKLARACTLLPESSSIDLGMPVTYIHT